MGINLDGEKFGKLTVLQLVEYREKGQSVWLIACDCGRTEEMSQLKIPYCKSNAARKGARYSCTVCHRGSCEICGGEIQTELYRGVCSPQCHHERKKRNDRKFYYNKIERDPSLNKRAYKKKKEKPEVMSKIRAYDRKRSSLRRKDKDYLESEREVSKARYERNKEAILARRQAIRDALTEDQLEKRREKQRERDRERERQKQINKLFVIGDKLNERDSEEN